MEIMGILTSSKTHASLKPCSEISASLVLKLNTLDARIGWTLSSIQQLELELVPASAYDYHVVFMSLVKPFLQLRMKDLVDIDACKNFAAPSSGADPGKQAKKKLTPKKRAKALKKDTINSEASGASEADRRSNERREKL